MEQPGVKSSTRNMFYDEQGKHRRTKKEILDEQGNIRAGCSTIPKGEIYESHIFILTGRCISGNEENRKEQSESRGDKGRQCGKAGME